MNQFRDRATLVAAARGREGGGSHSPLLSPENSGA
jgi:hypothetical protein